MDMISLIRQYSKEQIERIVSESHSIAEALRKMGYIYTDGTCHSLFKTVCEEMGVDYSHFSKYSGNKLKRNAEDIFIENSTAAQSTLRQHYIDGNYSEYKCALCGINEWNGKPLTLRLDHINGINKDDRIENLRWVCPNCDSQLPTYCSGHKGLSAKIYYCEMCGRKITKGRVYCSICRNNLKLGEQKVANKFVKLFDKENDKEYYNRCPNCNKRICDGAKMCEKCSRLNTRKVEWPTREELKILIRTRPFVKIGEQFGVSDNAVRKWCIIYNLPYKSSEIRNYTDEEWNMEIPYEEVLKRLELQNKPSKKILAKKVKQVDIKTNEIIAVYDSTRQAAVAIGVKSSSHIIEVCNGKLKSYKGFFWEYV